MTVQNATRVLLGTTGSSDRFATCEQADPASFPAGVAVRRSSTGGLVIADDSTAALIGVSLGIDLSSTKQTSVCRSGNFVPLRLVSSLVKSYLIFTEKTSGSGVTIEFLDTGTAGSEVVTVTGTAISVSMEDGTSTTTQLKTAIDASAPAAALISVAIASGGHTSAAQAAFAATALDYSFVVIGGVVTVAAATGHGAATGDATSAKYIGSAIDGVDAVTGLVSCKVALIDMGGGL